MVNKLVKPDEALSAEEYRIEKIAPSTAELILVAKQLTELALRLHMSPLHPPKIWVHERLCFDAILAVNEALIRRISNG